MATVQSFGCTLSKEVVDHSHMSDVGYIFSKHSLRKRSMVNNSFQRSVDLQVLNYYIYCYPAKHSYCKSHGGCGG